MFQRRVRFPEFVEHREQLLIKLNESEKGQRCRRPLKQFSRSPLMRDQQVALPQRALLIFSFSPSTPTAPTTICLPIT